MGYMGFGMRKEVYTRKPKKVFEKLKEVYGQKSENNNPTAHAKPAGPVSYEKHSYKPFYQTRFYKVLKAIFLSAILLAFIWAIFV